MTNHGVYQVLYRGDVIASVPNPGNYQSNPNHRYFKNTNNFESDYKSKVIFYLLERHCKDIGNSRKEWKKDNQIYHCTGETQGIRWRSRPINYKLLNKYITSKQSFSYADFGFPPYHSFFLDSSVDLSINFHIPNGKFGMLIQDYSVVQRFGHSVKITPQLDREGFTFSSLQPLLITEIIKLRKKLIENSHQALQPHWFFMFKELINNSISIVDMTLLQYYIKAEHAPEVNWTFDKNILGEKFSRRLTDKLKWIFQITGKNIDIEYEKKALLELNKIRNHLNHFDPPSFCATLEEVAVWLNQVVHMGGILFKIRIETGQLLSEEVMNLMLQPVIEFEPEPIFQNRVPLNTQVFGYNSAIWKDRVKAEPPKKSISKFKIFLITLLKRALKKLEE